MRLRRWHFAQQAALGQLAAGQRALTGDPAETSTELNEASPDRVLTPLQGIVRLLKMSCRNKESRTGFVVVKAMVGVMMRGTDETRGALIKAVLDHGSSPFPWIDPAADAWNRQGS